MKALSLLITLASLFISILLALVLAVSNPEQVTLLLGFFEVRTTSGQLIIFAFAFGAAAGVLGMLASVLSGELKAGFLQHRIEKLQSELASIKSNGIHENI